MLLRRVLQQQRRGFSSKSASDAGKLEAVVSLCKRRGYVFPGSDIYGGLANTYDFGPLGVLLKKNLRDMWWRAFVTSRPDVVGIETPILMNPEVWKATGHVDNFVDQLRECRACHHRVRADHHAASEPCPSCRGHDWTDPVPFNLLFQTRVGANAATAATAYLRPETAQGMFTCFPAVAMAARQRLPFGIAQVGRSFRNEVSPGHFLFRTREFEQAELEYFVPSEQADASLRQWISTCRSWLCRTVGLADDSVRIAPHQHDDLAHYARAGADLEYRYPFGWAELWGIADRGSFDLQAHHQASGRDMQYQVPGSSEKIWPSVIEPALGLDRLAMAVLCDGFAVEANRTVLRLAPAVAPVSVAVLPLVRRDAAQINAAMALHRSLAMQGISVQYDETGSIGKRYRRQDEIGTPLAVTVDADTATDGCVTVRQRDSMEQQRVALEDVLALVARTISPADHLLVSD